MSKEVGIIVLGLWLVVLPFLGFPGSWRMVFIFLSGLGIASLGFFLRAEALSRGKGRHDAPFTQNGASRVPHEGEQAKV